jgi:hypothetical protein
MKIKILESISAVHGSFSPGEIADWPDSKDAKRLIDAGIAEAVGGPTRTKKKVETAQETKSVETATE